MTRTMYDSTSAADIPTGAQMVAGYVDGEYRWSTADWDRFPDASKVGIATQPDSDAGDVLDIELGDATVADAVPWCERRIAAGLARPTIYCARFQLVSVIAATAHLPVDHWVADWTGQPHPVSGAAAVQYADPSSSGGHFDLSAVYDDAWHPSNSAPASAPEDPMTLEMAQLIVWGWYPAILRRLPAAQSEVDFWAAQLVAPGANYEQVATAFCATDEAQAALRGEH